MEIKITIRKLKKQRILDWWNNLPIQNLRDPLISWSGYTMKYYPDRGSCYGLTYEQIQYIWEQENKNR